MEEKEIGKPYKKKNGMISVSFSIKDCPLWLYKWFIDDTKRYNDIYWVRLKELHDMISVQEMMLEAPLKKAEPEETEGVPEELKKSYLVKTFGGEEKVEIETGERK
jgi:hypothetical protein